MPGRVLKVKASSDHSLLGSRRRSTALPQHQSIIASKVTTTAALASNKWILKIQEILPNFLLDICLTG